MCGIAGIVTRNPLQPDQIDLVARLNQIQQHRGPDGAGEFHDHHIAMAMRRLSIIDLTTGWQPLYNEDRSLALVANGEIYNFIELRQQLEGRGHRFSTRSDCETILHLYEEHGDSCVDHLRGMFAFALWDMRKRRLLLARDRMGEKPLYLACSNGQIVFSSELKTLVRGGVVPFDLDPHAVHLYYHYGYIPEPMVAVRGVRKLPAAHTLTIDVDRWRIDEHCYWHMEDAPLIEGDPATVIREELDRIGELIIRSDVPVGVALSGGMDASTIATLAAKKYPGTIQAFTVGYPGRPLQDERHEAKELADHLKIPFHEIEFSISDLISLFPKVNYYRDDPIADLSGPSYYAVMKAAREQGVPVMLMGQGGDELFWGYAWVRAALVASQRKFALRNGGAVGLADYLRITKPPYSYTMGLLWLKSLGGLLSGWRRYRSDSTSPADRVVFYDSTYGFQAASRSGNMHTKAFQAQIVDADATALFARRDPTSPLDITLIRLICETYLRENGIAQGDRLSMASSVELRLPLVDYRLVEIVIGLHKAHPVTQPQHKRWLQDAVRDIVPPFVMSRRKRGFGPPWRSWRKALSEAYGDQLVDGYLVQSGVLSSEAAREQRRRLSPMPWAGPDVIAGRSLTLENWCRQLSG
jgi:asparagine synthase (glutamine-hydrolysing)